MSVDMTPAPKINNCASCYGTGYEGYITGDGDYDIHDCDACDGKPDPRWGIRAVFRSNDDDIIVDYTYYDEVTYLTEQECLDAINGERGDLLSEASTIDSKEMNNAYLDDLEPYLIEENTNENQN